MDVVFGIGRSGYEESVGTVKLDVLPSDRISVAQSVCADASHKLRLEHRSQYEWSLSDTSVLLPCSSGNTALVLREKDEKLPEGL